MATILTKEFNSEVSMIAYELTASAWLKDNVGEWRSTVNLSDTISKAQLALKYRIARGGHWSHLNLINYVLQRTGDGWQIFTALTSGVVDETTVIIDDELLAVQFKLAVM